LRFDFEGRKSLRTISQFSIVFRSKDDPDKQEKIFISVINDRLFGQIGSGRISDVTTIELQSKLERIRRAELESQLLIPHEIQAT